MIGKLKGIVESTADDSVLLDVNGVGYVVFCSSKSISAIGAPGEAAQLFIETHVREDHIHLYGFATEAEKRSFKMLTSVQGVGSKVGLAILSALSADEITTAIAAQDKTAITRANGVGPKLAERIVTELKSKVGSLAEIPVLNKSGKAVVAGKGSAKNDAISALTNLGIARMDAFVAVNKVANDDMPLEQIITAALKEVGR
jgi:Holliday junction DNA helicase RuvA